MPHNKVFTNVQNNKNDIRVMKAIVTLRNFENEIKITCFSRNWNDLEDQVCEVEDNVNDGKPLFERYKSVGTKYYDNEGFEWDIYLKERI